MLPHDAAVMSSSLQTSVISQRRAMARQLLKHLDMRNTDRMEIALRVCFAGILAGVSGAVYVGCFCGGCGCGDNLPPPDKFTVTFQTTCPSDGGLEADTSLDAASDASTDGDASANDGDASADAATADADAGSELPCFATCAEACAALKPTGLTGDGVCDFADAGVDGAIVAQCETRIFCGGRKFDGLDAPRIEGSDFGALAARMAWLEAASVHAFRRLARELAAHGAPSELVSRAKACARDEIRHTRTMTKLATKHGVAVPRVTASRAEIRGLESIAIENAVEGCVGETYGALQAAWQASHERDADLAAAMSAIAPDELRHAALGWAVAAWLDTKLDDAERTRVREARFTAARAIVANAPSEDERALAKGLLRELWAA